MKIEKYKDKIISDSINNRNFVSIVEKYKGIIKSLEDRLQEAEQDKNRLARNGDEDI
jgi:hypothetical protein